MVRYFFVCSYSILYLYFVICKRSTHMCKCSIGYALYTRAHINYIVRIYFFSINNIRTNVYYELMSVRTTKEKTRGRNSRRPRKNGGVIITFYTKHLKIIKRERVSRVYLRLVFYSALTVSDILYKILYSNDGTVPPSRIIICACFPPFVKVTLKRTRKIK